MACDCPIPEIVMCYARGIVLTLAHDVIGTGPRLQMLTSDGEANRRIEQGPNMLFVNSGTPRIDAEECALLDAANCQAMFCHTP